MQRPASIVLFLTLLFSAGCGLDKPIYPAVPGVQSASNTDRSCQARALHWRKHLISEAQFGDASAQYKLGLYYYRYRDALTDGSCMDEIQQTDEHLEDRAIALNWFCLAANQGHPDAQFQLGRLYKSGEDPVTQDRVQAFKWYTLAAGNGQRLAAMDKSALVRDMTPEQIAEAERLVARWEPDLCQRQFTIGTSFDSISDPAP
jgi:TPR repeat protein